MSGSGPGRVKTQSMLWLPLLNRGGMMKGFVQEADRQQTALLERRLLYVAMSRAKDQLQVDVPRRLLLPYRAGGPGQHHVGLERSRFLPPSVFRYFESRDFAKKPKRELPITRQMDDQARLQADLAIRHAEPELIGRSRFRRLTARADPGAFSRLDFAASA
jgi:hypothetical protein